jgi:rfaE bifunctional protein nucleotidyltransferase chain/domain
MGQESKIKSREELIKTIEDFKKQGKKIVHCHGCFDLLHPGHIRHLRFAKEQGDVLLVSITGDNFVGKSYMNPFATQNLRAQSLASLQDVDLVYINESPIGTDLVKEIKPDIYIKGQEYARDKKVHPGFVEEKALVESLGGKIVYSPGDLIFSSSQIIKDLLERDDAKKERIYNFLVRHSIKRDNLIGVVKDYGLKKILVIGDLFLEDYVFCVKPKMSSNASVLNFELLNKKRFLGGTGLFAQNIVEMGANPIVLGIGNNKVLEIVNEKIKWNLSIKMIFHCQQEQLSYLMNKRLLN